MSLEKKDENEKEEEPQSKRGFMDDAISKEIEELEREKRQTVAKDLVKLTHVDTKKQGVEQDVHNLAKVLKDQMLEHDQFEKLSNDELTMLESIMEKRLFLTRIAIIVNQSRIPLGIEPFKKVDLENILNGLIEKGYVVKEIVGENDVYLLTERGLYRIQ